MSQQVGKYSHTIIQGSGNSDLVFNITEDDGSVIDLSGYKASMEIREDLSTEEVLDTLTTENGRITLEDDLNGLWTVSCLFPPDVSSDYTFETAEFKFYLIPSTEIPERWLEGPIIISKDFK